MITTIQIEETVIILERRIFTALEYYSNVHRGSGFKSQVSTVLYEKAREVILDYLNLDGTKYTVIFCSPGRAKLLEKQLNPGMYQILSSQDEGLSLGIRAIAVRKNSLPAGTPAQTGGGSARLVSPDSVVWAGAPDKFEAGTPAIINVIAFAMALQLIKKYGKEFVQGKVVSEISAENILYLDDFVAFAGQELLEKLRKNIIGNDILVPSLTGDKRYINLDNAASTPALVPVWNAFCNSMQLPDQIKQSIIVNVKSIISDFLTAQIDNYDIVFTSNTTESINLAALNLSRISNDEEQTVILNTFLEHTSDDLPWRNIPGSGIIRLKVDAEGFVDINEINSLLRDYNQNKIHGNKRIKLVAISGSSNVLGTCNKIEEISSIVHKYGADMLVDAAQLIAHRKINLDECGIDYLAFSGHKVYAPFGTGVLIARKGLLQTSNPEIRQIIFSGEENTAGIAALGKALVLIGRIGLDIIRKEEHILTARALKEMSRMEGLKIYGVTDPESPAFERKCGVIVFSIKGIWPDKVAGRLAKAGIGMRYGCHCAHILIKDILKVPPSLQRIQRIMVSLFPKIVLPGVARISLGIGNTKEDLDYFLSELKNISRTKDDNPNLRRKTEALIRDITKKVYET